MRIFLTGFMGAGKNTVGRALAPLLNMDFIDLDGAIERDSGRRIAGIFEDFGEGEFRELERRALQETPDNCVVATGGGCFIHNTDWMLQHGTVVLIDVPFAVLAERIGADPSRPLWKNAERLYEARQTVYRRAPVIVSGDADPETVAREIAGKLSGPR